MRCAARRQAANRSSDAPKPAGARPAGSSSSLAPRGDPGTHRPQGPDGVLWGWLEGEVRRRLDGKRPGPLIASRQRRRATPRWGSPEPHACELSSIWLGAYRLEDW